MKRWHDIVWYIGKVIVMAIIGGILSIATALALDDLIVTNAPEFYRWKYDERFDDYQARKLGFGHSHMVSICWINLSVLGVCLVSLLLSKFAILSAWRYFATSIVFISTGMAVGAYVGKETIGHFPVHIPSHISPTQVGYGGGMTLGLAMGSVIGSLVFLLLTVMFPTLQTQPDSSDFHTM